MRESARWGDNGGRKWNEQQIPECLDGQEWTRDERAERLFAGCKLSSELANVMKRDARNSATVSAVAPRFNSSAWRAAPPLFPPYRRPLFPSLFISAGGMTERVLSSRYAARATPRRSFCRWQLRDTKWAAHSVSHACRGFDARIARSTGPGPPRRPVLCGCRPTKSRDCDMTRRCHTVWAWAPSD